MGTGVHKAHKELGVHADQPQDLMMVDRRQDPASDQLCGGAPSEAELLLMKQVSHEVTSVCKMGR